jgi:hypothetical protein
VERLKHVLHLIIRGAFLLNKPEYSEEKLIHLSQKGDEGAFRTLVECYRSELFGTAYLITQDRQMTEEAVQETIIKNVAASAVSPCKQQYKTLGDAYCGKRGEAAIKEKKNFDSSDGIRDRDYRRL